MKRTAQRFARGLATLSVTAMLVAAPLQPSRAAGIPVIDVANLAKAVESVLTEGQQLLRLKEQLDYMEKQARSLTSGQQHFQLALGLYRRATALQARFQGLTNRFGNLDRYLASYRDVNWYASSGCLSGATSCTSAMLAELAWMGANLSRSLSQSQATATRILVTQGTRIEQSARTLERIQSAAPGAEGTLQALQFQHQIGALQARELLELRSQTTAYQMAEVTRMQVEGARESRDQAVADAMLNVTAYPGATRTRALGW